MNRKGEAGDMMSIGYFIFLILLIVGPIFIVGSVVMGKTYDARMADASLLGQKIEQCLDGRAASTAEIARIEQTCGINLGDSRYVLAIYSGEKTLYQHGDAVACGLYSLYGKDKEGTRCTESIAIASLDGKKAELRIITGSNVQEASDE